MVNARLMNNCSCGLNTVTRTSWTDLNPGRRYYACQNQDGGCNYFAWIDPPMGERARQIIPGLLRRVNNLEVQLRRLNAMQQGVGQVNAMEQGGGRVNELEDELRRLEEEPKCAKLKAKWLWIGLIVSWMFGYLFK